MAGFLRNRYSKRRTYYTLYTSLKATWYRVGLRLEACPCHRELWLHIVDEENIITLSGILMLENYFLWRRILAVPLQLLKLHCKILFDDLSFFSLMSSTIMCFSYPLNSERLISTCLDDCFIFTLMLPTASPCNKEQNVVLQSRILKYVNLLLAWTYRFSFLAFLYLTFPCWSSFNWAIGKAGTGSFLAI